MAARKGGTNNPKQAALTEEELRTAAHQMMQAAWTHQKASVWCQDKPNAKPPNIDAYHFMVVSFELILLSVEQSLRLFLLINYSRVLNDTNDNPRILFKVIMDESRGKNEIVPDIINRMNAEKHSESIEPFAERELLDCLGKHDASYSNFRYFQLDKHARLNPQWDITPREGNLLQCLGRALIRMNLDEMGKRGFPFNPQLNLVPESEMTPELNDLMQRMRRS